MSGSDQDFLFNTAAAKPDRPRRRLLVSMLSWLVFVVVLVIFSVNFERTVVMIEPERPPPAPVLPPAGTPPPAPVTPSAELLRAYGNGNLTVAGREAERVGLAAARAVICGRETTTWLSIVRTSLSDELTERYPNLDDNSRMPAILMEYAAARFKQGEYLAEIDVAQRGREVACAEAATASDYRAAQRAARRAAANANAQ